MRVGAPGRGVPESHHGSTMAKATCLIARAGSAALEGSVCLPGEISTTTDAIHPLLGSQLWEPRLHR